MNIKLKIWIEEQGQNIFGEGPRELLIRTEKYGSLSKAASSMRMSYSKAWNLINRIETVLGYKLLEKRTGGVSGGGSTLTDAARKFIEKYEYIQKELDKTINKINEEIF